MSSISQVADAFHLFYESLLRREFRKSFQFDQWSERDLLPLVRSFLLGYFGPRAEPERMAVLPTKLTGQGRFDFMVYDVAVELAVRRPWCPRGDVMPGKNADEVRKLLKYNGLGVLILLDYSATPLTRPELEGYRDLPSLGRGNHAKSGFSVVYYAIGRDPIRLNVRA
jgi:hypothetical protein